MALAMGSAAAQRKWRHEIAASLLAGLSIVAFGCGGPAAAVGHEGGDATAMMFPETTSDLDGGRCDGSPQGVLGAKVTLDVSWGGVGLTPRGLAR